MLPALIQGRRHAVPPKPRYFWRSRKSGSGSMFRIFRVVDHGIYFVTEFAQTLQFVNQSTAADPQRLRCFRAIEVMLDRKSTRLNSSHSQISYAVFCLKKKKN